MFFRDARYYMQTTATWHTSRSSHASKSRCLRVILPRWTAKHLPIEQRSVQQRHRRLDDGSSTWRCWWALRKPSLVSKKPRCCVERPGSCRPAGSSWKFSRVSRPRRKWSMPVANYAVPATFLPWTISWMIRNGNRSSEAYLDSPGRLFCFRAELSHFNKSLEKTTKVIAPLADEVFE
jgi:hypothetical protein